MLRLSARRLCLVKTWLHLILIIIIIIVVFNDETINIECQFQQCHFFYNASWSKYPVLDLSRLPIAGCQHVGCRS